MLSFVAHPNSIPCAVACCALLWAYLIDLLLAFNHTQQRVVEPVLELRMTGKNLGHEEVHQGPQLHQIILQGRACKAAKICIKPPLIGLWLLFRESKLRLLLGAKAPVMTPNAFPVLFCLDICSNVLGVDARHQKCLHGLDRLCRNVPARHQGGRQGVPARYELGLHGFNAVCRGVSLRRQGVYSILQG